MVLRASGAIFALLQTTGLFCGGGWGGGCVCEINQTTPKGKQKHTLQYIMNISLPYCLLLLTSSNGKCRLISHCEQPAGLMDQQWHMCSCASLVSRCVSLSLLPRCPSKPSFVSIVVMPSIRQVKKRKHNICHCRSVCLTYCPPAPGSHQLPALLMGFVLPS